MKCNLSKLLAMLVVLTMLAATVVSCGPTPEPETIIETVEVEKEIVQTVEVEKEIFQTVEVEKEVLVEVTKVVREEVEKVVTATPEPGQVVSEPKEGGELRIAQQGGFGSFDPDVGVSYEDWITIYQLFNGLYQMDRENRIYPDLAAEMPTVSEDGKTYTISIRQGVKFHDGSGLTCEDVEYSLTRTLIPETRSWGPSYLVGILGAQDVLDGKTRELQGVECLDDYTIQITLAEPQAAFLWNLTTAMALVVPKDYVEEVGLEYFGQHPVGTGPYVFGAYIPGQSLILTANHDFFGNRRPHIETLEFSLGVDPSVALLRLEKGEIDVMFDAIPDADFISVTTEDKWKGWYDSSIIYRTAFLGMNTQMEPFTDKRVRQAVAMSVNRDRFVKLTHGAVAPARAPLAPGIAGHLPDYGFDYDPVRARELLAEAGYPDGFSVEMLVREIPRQVLAAQAIQQDLALVGIEASIRVVPSATFHTMVGEPNKVAMGFASAGASFPDPYDEMSLRTCVQASAGTRYPEYYCNPEYDALIGEAETFPLDSEERIKRYQEAQRILIEDSPRAYVYYDNKYVAHTPDLKGFYVHSVYWFWWSDYWLDR